MPRQHAGAGAGRRPTPWGIKERLTLEKTALGFYLSGHLFDQSARTRCGASCKRAHRRPDRQPRAAAAGRHRRATCASSTASAAGVAIFKLDDKTEAIEAVANEELLNANRDLLKDDELVIVQGKVQPDRFSGGLRLNVQQVWDLAGGALPLRQVPARRGQRQRAAGGRGAARLSVAPRRDRARRAARRAWRCACVLQREQRAAASSTSATRRASFRPTRRSRAGAKAVTAARSVVYE